MDGPFREFLSISVAENWKQAPMYTISSGFYSYFFIIMFGVKNALFQKFNCFSRNDAAGTVSILQY